jgi:hypothetical protein
MEIDEQAPVRFHVVPKQALGNEHKDDRSQRESLKGMQGEGCVQSDTGLFLSL